MAEQSKLWYLKNFNILEGMDEATMERVAKLTLMTTLKTHDPIYFPDQPSRSIFFLKRGHVKISRIHPDGREVILDVVGPGEIFGELALIEEGEESNDMAQALDDALICAMKVSDFESLMKSNPDMNMKVTKRIGLRLRKFEERVTDLVFKDSKKRIASFLVHYAEDFGKMKLNVVNIKMHLTHQEIALLTGAARQTITTTLNEFRTLGLIDFSRQEITIKQFDKLKRLAQ